MERYEVVVIRKNKMKSIEFVGSIVEVKAWLFCRIDTAMQSMLREVHRLPGVIPHYMINEVEYFVQKVK